MAWIPKSQCTYRCVVLPDTDLGDDVFFRPMSQCTYRCVVLPDGGSNPIEADTMIVSMHLQVRGAP